MTRVEEAKQAVIMRRFLDMFCEDFETKDCAVSLYHDRGICWSLYIYWGNPVWQRNDLPKYLGMVKTALAEDGIMMLYCMCDKNVTKTELQSKKYLVLQPR